MLITNKETQCEETDSRIPLILTLNSGGEPVGWISYQDCAFLRAKNKILWSLGNYEVKLFGGINAKTGLQSTLSFDTIVAVTNDKSPSKYKKVVPALSNKALFERDRNMCAYCGMIGKRHQLTRDHILAISRGGLDTWSNTITSCFSCNNWKSDMTLEESGMQLLFLPYTPSFNEALILKNRNILPDQFDFLSKGISKHSRLLN